ncbi:MAG: hypothetical protein ACOVOV_06910, partial [Dolichospermum sp.]
MYLPTVASGQVYVVLITNFSNQAGTITFNQTGGTASTDCSIVCPEVTLPADINLCSTTSTSTTITASTTVVPTTYQWFLGNTLLPFTTNQITVNQSGVYKCIVTKAGCPNSEDTINVTFNQPTIPTFTQVAPICSGSALAALPSTSSNGITGTWSPALNNTATTLYTFTPTVGQCASPTSMTIEVNNCNAFIYATAVWMDDCTTVGDGKFYNTSGAGVDLINQDGSVFAQNYGIHVQNSGTLILRGAEVKTQKSNSANICSSTLFYRVFSGTPSGSFTARNLQFFSDCNSGTNQFNVGGGPCVTGQQKWQCVSQPAPCDAPFDFTSLAPGNYTIQVYYQATGSFSTSNGCTDVITLDNGGAYYTANFTIQAPETITFTNPTTCNGSDGIININNLISNTTYSISYLSNGVLVGPLNFTSNSSGEIVINNLSVGSYSNFTITINSCSRVNNTIINLSTPTTPVVTVNSTTVCEGTNAIITATPSIAGTYNFDWTVPAGFTNPGNVASFSTNVAGNYCVIVTNTSTLCSSVSVCGVLSTQVQPNAGQNGSLTVCSGSTITNAELFAALSGTPDTGGVWSGPVAGVYTYTINPIAPCTIAATSTVTINTINTPDIDLGPDQSICDGNTVTLTAPSGYTSYLWSNGANTQSITVSSSNTYTVTGTNTALSTLNLVTNPNFNNGINGYTSSYIQGNGGLYGLVSDGNTYTVVTNPNLAHDHNVDCPYQGNMFVANGGDLGNNQNVLCQTINITPNTNYIFSIDAINPHLDAGFGTLPLTLNLEINGTTVATITPPMEPNNCNWQTYTSSIWNSGSSTTASICIKNNTTTASLLAI